MSDLSAPNIVNVLNCMIGPVEPVGDSYLDKERMANVQKLEHVAEHVIGKLLGLTKYVARPEDSMWRIGNDAAEFLKYITEDYELISFTEEDDESE